MYGPLVAPDGQEERADLAEVVPQDGDAALVALRLQVSLMRTAESRGSSCSSRSMSGLWASTREARGGR